MPFVKDIVTEYADKIPRATQQRLIKRMIADGEITPTHDRSRGNARIVNDEEAAALRAALDRKVEDRALNPPRGFGARKPAEDSAGATPNEGEGDPPPNPPADPPSDPPPPPPPPPSDPTPRQPASSPLEVARRKGPVSVVRKPSKGGAAAEPTPPKPNAPTGKRTLPTWVLPVVGIVILVVVLLFLWRRRASIAAAPPAAQVRPPVDSEAAAMLSYEQRWAEAHGVPMRTLPH